MPAATFMLECTLLMQLTVRHSVPVTLVTTCSVHVLSFPPFLSASDYVHVFPYLCVLIGVFSALLPLRYLFLQWMPLLIGVRTFVCCVLGAILPSIPRPVF